MNPVTKLLVDLYDDPNCGSLCMFLYNVKAGVPITQGEIRRSEISPMMNSSVSMDGGYTLDPDTYIFANSALDSLREIELRDFGITIIMFLFARYYSHNQYAIMVNTLHGIKELECLELYLKTSQTVSVATRSESIHNNPINTVIRAHLLTAGDSTIGISPIVASNLATDAKYGLFANADKFINNDILTLSEFKFITSAISSKTLTSENFISLINGFHLHIVESFYTLTSITKDSKVIIECRELSIPQMKYTFVRPVRSAIYHGDYWFVVPSGAVWFAHHQGYRTYQSYVSRDIDQVIDRALENVTSGILVGFIFENSIYPTQLDTPDCNGNWERTISEFSRYGLPVIFHDDKVTPPPLDDPKRNKRIFFVKRSIPTLYRYTK